MKDYKIVAYWEDSEQNKRYWTVKVDINRYLDICQPDYINDPFYAYPFEEGVYASQYNKDCNEIYLHPEYKEDFCWEVVDWLCKLVRIDDYMFSTQKSNELIEAYIYN